MERIVPSHTGRGRAGNRTIYLGQLLYVFNYAIYVPPYIC